MGGIFIIYSWLTAAILSGVFFTLIHHTEIEVILSLTLIFTFSTVPSFLITYLASFYYKEKDKKYLKKILKIACQSVVANALLFLLFMPATGILILRFTLYLILYVLALVIYFKQKNKTMSLDSPLDDIKFLEDKRMD